MDEYLPLDEEGNTIELVGEPLRQLQIDKMERLLAAVDSKSAST